MVPASDHIYLDTEVEAPVETLTSMMGQLMKYALDYKFFYAEQFTLFKNDPLLQQMYRKRWDMLIEHLTEMFIVWQEKGFMKTSSREWKKELAGYFLITGPANLRSNLFLYPEFTSEEALRKALNSVLLVVSGDFVEEVCEEILAVLKG